MDALSFSFDDEDGYEADNKEMARLIAIKVISDLDNSSALSTIEFVARGEFNHVWLVTYTTTKAHFRPQIGRRFALRISRRSSPLQPYRIRHEVACLRFLAANCPSIPAPKVLVWDDGTAPDSRAIFIAEEYVEGQCLSVAWPRLTEHEKSTIIHEIAKVLVVLGETRFTAIGGIALNATAGPTIEMAKRKDCYDIGPYDSVKAYVLACLDREIHYYTHARASDLEIVADAFARTSVSAFVTQLRRHRVVMAKQDACASDNFAIIDEEPLVLVHGDFHANNMLVRDGHLAGIVDWEYAGTYPLSELLGCATILRISVVLPDRDPECDTKEEKYWHARYLAEVERVARARGWKERYVKRLIGGSHDLLSRARRPMFPDDVDDNTNEV